MTCLSAFPAHEHVAGACLPNAITVVAACGAGHLVTVLAGDMEHHVRRAGASLSGSVALMHGTAADLTVGALEISSTASRGNSKNGNASGSSDNGMPLSRSTLPQVGPLYLKNTSPASTSRRSQLPGSSWW